MFFTLREKIIGGVLGVSFFAFNIVGAKWKFRKN